MAAAAARVRVTGRRALRLGGVGVLGAAWLVLAGCQAQGAGVLREPAPGSEAVGTWTGPAAFVFRYRCDVRAGTAVARGDLYYRDAGASTVEVGGTRRTFGPLAVHGAAAAAPAGGACGDAGGIPAAQFEGEYRVLPAPQWTPPGPGERRLPFEVDLDRPPSGGPPEGRFVVLVFDQGPRGGPAGPDVTGDGFSIELRGGPYDGYTRAGYIERGDVRVR